MTDGTERAERIDGRVRVRAAAAALLPAEHTPNPFSLADLFEDELSGYAELIVGPGGRPFGFMTHSDGPIFTEKVRVSLTQLGMPAPAIEHQQQLARWFEHLRAFFKVEWHRTERGVEPLAAVYFRRRPPIDEVLERLELMGVGHAPRARAAELARLVDKDTVHFVSAAFRPGQPVHHKLYFSQWVTPETRDRVAAGLSRVFELYGFGPGAIEAWRAQHDRTILPDESTLFVSLSFTADTVSPSFKIDYPDVETTTAAAWLPADQRAAVKADVQRAHALAGTRVLTFLGVRFVTDRAAPSLKYYCDVPGSR